jgi:hypothetical protein
MNAALAVAGRATAGSHRRRCGAVGGLARADRHHSGDGARCRRSRWARRAGSCTGSEEDHRTATVVRSHDRKPSPRCRTSARRRCAQGCELRLSDAVFNETLVLAEHLPPTRRAAFALWSAMIGTSAEPGLLQLPRVLVNDGRVALRRWRATQRARREGLREAARNRRMAKHALSIPKRPTLKKNQIKRSRGGRILSRAPFNSINSHDPSPVLV